jgi:hypothetical protein
MPGWLGEEVERLPEVLQAGLKPQWNDWLRRRYETTAALRRAWSAGEQSPGQEMITNADLGLGLEGCVLERQPGAEATAALSEEAPAALPHARSVCVTVAKPGIQSWHIRFEQPGRKVEANRAYTLSFWAKSERAGATNLSLEQTHSPWQNLGMSCQALLTPEWKPFSLHLHRSPKRLGCAPTKAARGVDTCPPLRLPRHCLDRGQRPRSSQPKQSC